MWAADITPDDTPYEARARVLRQARQAGRVPRPDALRCVRATASPRAGCAASRSPTRASVALGNEPVRIGGEIAGRVTSGGYGYSVERSIAYAYVPAEHAAPGTAVEIDIFGEWVGGGVAREPLCDPNGERVRG